MHRSRTISALLVATVALVLGACTPTATGGGSTTTSTTAVPDTTTTTAVPDTTTTTAVPDTTTTTAVPATTTTTTVAGGGGPTPTAVVLLVSQASAFAVLGRSCGGIQEQSFATGFDAATGLPTGAVYLQTRCGGSGRGGGYTTTTYSAWVTAVWDWSGGQVSVTASGAPASVDPAFTVFDAHGAELANSVSAINVAPSACSVGNTTYCTYRARLVVPVPSAPTGVTAVQVGDQFAVQWTPISPLGPVVVSSTVVVTPVGSSAPVLTGTVAGPATTAGVGPLQPETTYAVTVANSTAGGSGPASDPVLVTTPPSSVVPSAPTGVTVAWSAPGLPGDSLLAGWTAGAPGDSPIDQYQVTATVSDGPAGSPAPVTVTVAGSVTNASAVINDVYDWSVTVRAHNAAGWGAWSSPVVLPGA